MIFKRMVILGLALLTAGCCCKSGEKVIDSKTTYGRDALLPYVKSGELPGAISVFYQNGVQETACVGWADVDKKIPMTMDKMFMQCSQTKGFCGVTIAILVEEGKLSLDDPVSKYLPEFKTLKMRYKDKNGKWAFRTAKNVLTVRMVMNHTGGFSFETPTKNKIGWCGAPLRETAREAASSMILRFEPGTGSLYSNTGIDIGAAVTEVITGKPWEVFLKERVLDPLEMKDTTFQPTDEQLARSIQMYDVKAGTKAKYKAFNRWMPRPYNGPTIFPSAGAGLWTTAADQLKFYKMLMNLGVGVNGKRILKEETVKKLLLTSTRPAKLGRYSLGLSVAPDGWVGHGGAWGTNCSFNWKTRQLRLWVVQINGKGPHPWSTKWREALNKFFAGTIDTKASDAYTGRMK